ncbi:BQ5605_C015g07804 [Microbotryum silenes-dioicae]|uniref:BQ5605_C015g07804 protein n=1 Tax=Microbotryum silenes-dioicae TaxID=796604 RepID=A0A2X0MMK7_9BASI|nr:BQ5605_C015g07804 [Microbotryum silenes-dioicae]
MEYRVLGEHKQLGNFNTWRAFIWIPISMHAFFVTWASTQAFLVVSARSRSGATRTDRQGYVPAKVANGVFYGSLRSDPSPPLPHLEATQLIGSPPAAPQIVDTLCASAWRRAWKHGVDFGELLNVQSLYADLTTSAAHSLPYQNAVVLMVIIVPFTIGLLNIGSIGLLLTLRRKINASIRRRSIRPDVGFVSLGASDSTGMPKHLVAFPTRTTGVRMESQDVKELTGSTRPSLAQRFSTSLTAFSTPSSFDDFSTKHGDGSASKPLEVPLSPGLSIDLGGNVDMSDLRRAEKDLIVFYHREIWNYICILPNDSPKWAEFELSYFFVPWVYSIIYSIGCTALFLNLVSVRRSRSRSHNPAEVQSDSTFEHGSTGPPVISLLPDGRGLALGDLSRDEAEGKLALPPLRLHRLGGDARGLRSLDY